MPCYQSPSFPPGFSTTGRTSYATEAECNQACKEGACCEGTTCSVRPQCQCQGAGQTFKGVGTTCGDSSVYTAMTLTLDYTQTDYFNLIPGFVGCERYLQSQLGQPGYDTKLADCRGELNGQIVFSMTRQSAGYFTGSGNGVTAIVSISMCSDPRLLISTSFKPFGSFIATSVGVGISGDAAGGVFDKTQYLFNMIDRSQFTTLVTYPPTSTFPYTSSETTFVANRTPQTVTDYFIDKGDGTSYTYSKQAWQLRFRATLS